MTSRARNIRVITNSRPLAAMISQVYNRYPPYYNKDIANKIFSITPPAPAPQIYIPAVKYPGLLSSIQGTGISIDIIIYIPYQY
jgi:hypothetical protein